MGKKFKWAQSRHMFTYYTDPLGMGPFWNYFFGDLVRYLARIHVRCTAWCTWTFSHSTARVAVNMILKQYLCSMRFSVCWTIELAALCEGNVNLLKIFKVNHRQMRWLNQLIRTNHRLWAALCDPHGICHFSRWWNQTSHTASYALRNPHFHVVIAI